MNRLQRTVISLLGLRPTSPNQAAPSSVWIDDDDDNIPAAKASAYGAGGLSALWLSGSDLGERPFVYPDNPIGWMMAARYNVWVSNCLKARSNAVSSVALKLYQISPDPENVDPEEITDHPVVKLLARCNPLEGKRAFYRQGERQLGVHGEWYLLKIRGLDGKPAELHRLPAQWVYPKIGINATRVDGYQYLGSLFYSPDDVIRIYYPREDYPVWAESPTQTALFAANSYNMADVESQFRDKRGGQGGGIISVDASGAKDWARVKAEWDSVRSDPRNAGRDAFLPAGAKYESGVLSARDQQKEERSGRLAKEIMAAFSVPPSLAGDYSDASVLANAAQQSTNFWQTCVVPELEYIAEALTMQLLWSEWPETIDQGYFLGFDLSGVQALQPDRMQEAQVEEVYSRIAGQRITDTLSTINEGREYIGLEEVDDDRANQLFAVLRAEATTTPPGSENPTGAGSGPPTDKGSDPPPEAPPNEDGTPTEGNPPGSETDPEAEMSPTKAIAADYVGLKARSATTGGAVGTVEKVFRFGIHGGIRAHKRDPVFRIDGKFYAANDVVLLMEE